MQHHTAIESNSASHINYTLHERYNTDLDIYLANGGRITVLPTCKPEPEDVIYRRHICAQLKQLLKTYPQKDIAVFAGISASNLSKLIAKTESVPMLLYRQLEKAIKRIRINHPFDHQLEQLKATAKAEEASHDIDA